MDTELVFQGCLQHRNRVYMGKGYSTQPNKQAISESFHSLTKINRFPHIDAFYRLCRRQL